MCDLGLQRAVLGMPMADFRSWLLRKDGGVEGRVADTRTCVGMEVRVCTGSRIAETGWLRHGASPIGVQCAVARVLQMDAIRV